MMDGAKRTLQSFVTSLDTIWPLPIVSCCYSIPACSHVIFHSDSLAAVEGLFGSGEGPILLDNVMCSGEEESILACHAEELGMSNCFHTEDAGVVCPSE